MNQLSGRSCNRNRYTMVHKPHQNPSMLLEHNFPTLSTITATAPGPATIADLFSLANKTAIVQAAQVGWAYT